MPIRTAPEDYTMLASGGTVTFSTTGVSTVYNLNPNDGEPVAITTNLTISPAGAPIEGLQYVFNYGGLMGYDGGTVTIFSRLLTAAEAYSKFTITCTYTNAAWVVKFMFSDLSSISGTYLADGTVTNAKLLGSITLAKLLAATRGYLIRAQVDGIWTAFSAVTAGNLVMGNGTDVVSQSMVGDATIDGSGVLTIVDGAVTTDELGDAAVTVPKVSADLKAEVVVLTASFDSGEIGAYTFRMPYPGSVTHFYAEVIKVMGGTDAGTAILKNNAGTTMTATTPISIPASTAIGTAYSTAITANNTFAAGDIITVFTAKTTVGGNILGSVGILRS